MRTVVLALHPMIVATTENGTPASNSAVPAPVPYANLTNPQTLNLYAMVSDNPETFADFDGHDPAPDGGVVQSDTLAEDGEPAACAEMTGCAEYELQVSDGDNDTATEENNADARNDATVDGTATQVAPPQAPPSATGKTSASVLDKLAEDIDTDIDAVVKPLIESASEKALPLVEGAVSDVIGPVIMAADFVFNAPSTASAKDDERPRIQGAEHKEGSPMTKEKHEYGQARKKRDKGCEKADAKRRKYGKGWGKRPDKWKGPWPPRDDE